jgi:hypothetical protein
MQLEAVPNGRSHVVRPPFPLVRACHPIVILFPRGNKNRVESSGREGNLFPRGNKFPVLATISAAGVEPFDHRTDDGQSAALGL